MNYDKLSFGFIEARQYVEALVVLDHMLKSNHIELESLEQLGSGYLTIVIKGDLASVQMAVEEAMNCSLTGDISGRVIAKPYPGWERMITKYQQGMQRGDEDGS
ncbi:BMC domain-containing protein [Alkalicoccus daliensis]|uniref:BMC domain-containing protein n=1 Tax=Alkalicoccus daliensis TaxID=745820 RepID=A0A1H0HCF2_9BACI|nr:BMC domain-containing protein [Alkalicoccus daliensis]SDO16740.1 BMC domain-containing protein [Alkalicoccus daliensis]